MDKIEILDTKKDSKGNTFHNVGNGRQALYEVYLKTESHFTYCTHANDYFVYGYVGKLGHVTYWIRDEDLHYLNLESPSTNNVNETEILDTKTCIFSDKIFHNVGEGSQILIDQFLGNHDTDLHFYTYALGAFYLKCDESNQVDYWVRDEDLHLLDMVSKPTTPPLLTSVTLTTTLSNDDLIECAEEHDLPSMTDEECHHALKELESNSVYPNDPTIRQAIINAQSGRKDKETKDLLDEFLGTQKSLCDILVKMINNDDVVDLLGKYDIYSSVMMAKLGDMENVITEFNEGVSTLGH